MEANPSPVVRARQETQGKDWVNKVFTGTHERIEGHAGVVRNNMDDNGEAGGFTASYF